MTYFDDLPEPDVQILPDAMFRMRVRDDSIEGDNPFRWDYKTTKELFAGKKILVISLPGAFTPTCSNSQVPGFEEMAQKFYDKGVDEIWCVSVNDAFVMYQWSQHLGVKEIKMLPDGNAEFTEGMGMLVDKRNLGFGGRSWRYVALIDNLFVEHLFVEDGMMNNCPYDPYVATTPENVYNNI